MVFVPVLLEEGNRILIGEAIERTVEKFAVAADVVEKFLHLARIREIATALSCDVQLFSAFFIFFKQMDLVASSAAEIAANIPAAPPPITRTFFIFFSFSYPASLVEDLDLPAGRVHLVSAVNLIIVIKLIQSLDGLL